MTQSKVTLSDPKEILEQVDPNQISTLLTRDEGNTFVLDSINAKSEAAGGVSSLLDGLDIDTGIAASISEQSGKILTSIEGMKESGAFADVTGDFDFSAIAEQCSIANSEDLMGTLGAAFTALGETGDLLSLDKMREALDFAGFDSLGIIASVAPGVVATTLSVFNLDELIPNLSEDLLGPYASTFNDALNNFSTSWYWLDESLGIYDYEVLSRISPWALNFLELNPNYTEVVKLARGLYGHRNQISE
ncbi:hypothetical protein TSMG0072 [Halocynthia phage JM-2012]|uniref:hypothetical protein n=1 Tax=Halocynthia phage JM-2012 TaxID=1173297 RepID=UPI00025C691C|nr:hypothetical protein TSMG0072 [Halocynthia phage JM-2012]AFI55355.1 hypothetical protein TSMG0072 [Halocynthia phage JM-2012]